MIRYDYIITLTEQLQPPRQPHCLYVGWLSNIVIRHDDLTDS